MFKYNWQRRIVAATPLIAVLIFLSVGFIWDLWHPGWVAFLLIPTVPFLVGLKQIRITFPLFVLVSYFVIGFLGYWHPGWLVFLLIPIQNILFPPKAIMKYVKDAERASNKTKSYVDAEFND